MAAADREHMQMFPGSMEWEKCDMSQAETRKKLVSIMVPCFNEEENVVAIAGAIVDQMNQLPQYDYEILFIDNCSTDGTRALIRSVCAQNPKIRAIFNVKNFGQFNSPYYGICQTSGDCTISICSGVSEILGGRLSDCLWRKDFFKRKPDDVLAARRVLQADPQVFRS